MRFLPVNLDALLVGLDDLPQTLALLTPETLLARVGAAVTPEAPAPPATAQEGAR